MSALECLEGPACSFRSTSSSSTLQQGGLQISAAFTVEAVGQEIEAVLISGPSSSCSRGAPAPAPGIPPLERRPWSRGDAGLTGTRRQAPGRRIGQGWPGGSDPDQTDEEGDPGEQLK